MSHSNSSPTVRLQVYATHPMTEISVTDGRFRQVLRAVGSVEQDLKPGLYEVEFRAGDSVHSEYVVLDPDAGTVTVRGPELAFSTPAPIAGTQTSREYHVAPAQRLSASAQAPKGASSGGLFIFVRDLEPIGRPKNPARGVSLLDLAGDELIKEDSDAWEQDIDQQWAGISLPIEPAAYRLRVRTQVAGILEQTIVVRPDWQTQVFMDQRSFHRLGKRTARRADLLNASIFMARVGGGSPDPAGSTGGDVATFNPASEDLRQTELARMGLADRRMVVPERDLQEMLWAKLDNPMLGIFAGHLLLLSPQPDVALLEQMIANLRSLIGAHPDVQALDLKLARLTGATLSDPLVFEAPPMLLSSWQIVVEASVQYADLVPPGSLSAQISDRIWAEGAWLVWRHLRTRQRAEPVAISALSDALPQLTDRLSDPDWLEELQASNLDTAERSLLNYLKTVIDQAQYQEQMPPAREREALPEAFFAATPESYLSEEVLVDELNLPSATVGQAAAGLLEKMDLKA
jgi:hypothetical protein